MFRHILKEKKIVVDCFTQDPIAYDYAKIKYGHEAIPQWWKDMPTGVSSSSEDPLVSIKACRGLRRYYDRGFVIPLWGDLHIDIMHKGAEFLFKWECSNPNFSTHGSHNAVGFEGYSKSDGFNIKFTSPWFFKSKSAVEFMMSQPTWSDRELSDNMALLPGVLDFKYQYVTNLNFFLRTGTSKKRITLEAGTPLAILHPLTEDKVIIKNHLVDKREHDRMVQDCKFFSLGNVKQHFSLYNRRKKLFNSIDEIKVNKLESSCPFKPK